MKYKAISIDMDGTLLDDKLKRVSKRDCESIRAMKEAGMKIILTSGRACGGILPDVKRLGLDNTEHVSDAGASYFDYNGHVTCNVWFDREESLSAMRFLREMQVPFVCATSEYIIHDDLGEPMVALVHHNNGDTKIIKSDAQTVESQLKIVKIIMQFPNADKKQRLIDFVAGFNSLRFVDAGELADLLPTRCHKAMGLSRVIQKAGILPEEVIAVGDQNNDIENIQQAGLGCAVANASDDLKAVADVVLNHDNNHDPITEIYERFVLPEIGFVRKEA